MLQLKKKIFLLENENVKLSSDKLDLTHEIDK